MKDNLSFEKNISRLEQIVRLMERGDVSLDESLKLFREGTELAQNCTRLLDEAELVINKVLKDSNGEPTEGVFPHEEEI